MIRVRRLEHGQIVTREGPEALDRQAWGDDVVWVAVIAPDEDELQALAAALPLHRLALRDALSVKQPPKFEDFVDHLFFIVHTPVKKAWTETRRIAVFLAPGWIVTIQRTRSAAVDQVAARIEADPGHFLTSPDALAHAVIDHMTAGFETLTADLIEEMTGLEDRVLNDPSPASMKAILELRRRVIGLTRVTRSQRDVCGSICRTPHDAIGREAMPFFRDVYDHTLRVYDLLESAREGLAVTRDAYLSVVNNRLSEIMRTLTVIATVMMPLSLLAGIYGMNFEIMPGLHSPAGFWIMVAVMVGLGVGMLAWFRKRGWF